MDPLKRSIQDPVKQKASDMTLRHGICIETRYLAIVFHHVFGEDSTGDTDQGLTAAS